MASSGSTVYGLGELARTAGLPVGTVKYYLREGLVPEGRLRSATRADYGPEHLERLQLLRMLREVGDVPVERLRDLVAALEQRSAHPLAVLATGADAIAGAPPAPGPLAERAAVLGAELAAGAGWTELPQEAPGWAALRSVLEVVLGWEETGLPVSSTDLAAYAEAADLVARRDVGALDDGADPTRLVTQLVVGQVVYGRLLEALRRLAEAEHSIRRWA